MTQSYVRSEEGLNKFLSKSYLTVALGVGISAIIAYVSSMFVDAFMYNHPGISLFLVLALVVGELTVAITLSTRIEHMSKSTAWVCYIAYSVLTGFSFSTIVSEYLPGSVAFAFASTAIMFVCMAIIGLTSRINYEHAYSFLLPFCIAATIVSLLNVFVFRVAWINMLIVYAGLILFLFITAADSKRLRDYYYASMNNDDVASKYMIIGAFALYLDFVNLFIKILHILGKRRRD